MVVSCNIRPTFGHVILLQLNYDGMPVNTSAAQENKKAFGHPNTPIESNSLLEGSPYYSANYFPSCPLPSPLAVSVTQTSSLESGHNRFRREKDPSTSPSHAADIASLPAARPIPCRPRTYTQSHNTCLQFCAFFPGFPEAWPTQDNVVLKEGRKAE